MHQNGLSRRSVLSWAAGLGVAIPTASLLSACGGDGGGSGSGGGGTRRTYQTALGYNVGNCPEMVAREAGFFKDLGLDVDVISSTGTPQAMSGLIAGSTAYTRFQSISALITIANEDAPFVAIGMPVQRTAFELQSMAESPVAGIAELEGRAVGVVSAGGTTDQLIDLMAVQAGIDPGSIERKVTGLGTAAYQFAKKGDVAAWIGSAAEREALEEAGSGVHAWNFDDVMPVPADTYLTTRDELDKHRDVVVKVLAGFYQALEFVCEESNDAQTIEWIRKYNREITPEDAQEQLDLVRPLYLARGEDQLMALHPQEWEQMQEALLGAKLIGKSTDLSKVVHPDLLAEAKALL
ncbi:ABC transporter substrate-binding protein [Nocardioides sp. zg-DK7169]|uniref:ABC transporter substrate-binding protein n=1 Tax=Nocardioides sp. zg-DK7169 TaxID=2736600 RepID=UPI001554D59F|nr:ABC transporter substrate-binding protein [Nocardioides sp. zg-DK7169]NPC97614.1 ABC transporter substrate-binding protein [Nocardioides sp. zg-DK7169]